MMRKPPPLHLEPTFPLNEAELATRIGWRRWLRVETWAVLVGGGAAAVGLGAIPGADPMAFLAVGASTVGALFLTWELKKGSIESDVMAEMISESNDSQDQRIARQVRAYRKTGHHAYAMALGRFLILKKHIEERIHSGAELLSMDAAEIDVLVDGICNLVCRQFGAAAELDRDLAAALTSSDPDKLEAVERKRREVLAPVREAYATLWETYENLAAAQQIQSMSSVVGDLSEQGDVANPDDLLAIIDSLKEENRIAERVRARVVGEMDHSHINSEAGAKVPVEEEFS